MEKQAEEVRALMVSIAHAAIASRAALDGHAPGAYDLDGDPEGYVVSLLNALHRWCHENGVDWEAELDRAAGHFREDSGAMGQAQTTRPPPTADEMRCPACGHTESFLVEVSEVVLVFADGDKVYGDAPSQYDDGSHCTCHGCGHAARVRGFRAAEGARHG